MSNEFNPANYPNASQRELAIRKRVHKTAEFQRHALIYVCVISCLWVLCLLTIPSRADPKLWNYWAIWPTFGWGIGLFFHGISLVPGMVFLSDEWEEKKVQELMSKSDGR